MDFAVRRAVERLVGTAAGLRAGNAMDTGGNERSPAGVVGRERGELPARIDVVEDEVLVTRLVVRRERRGPLLVVVRLPATKERPDPFVGLEFEPRDVGRRHGEDPAGHQGESGSSVASGAASGTSAKTTVERSGELAVVQETTLARMDKNAGSVGALVTI